MARVKYLTVARGERLHIENYPSFHKSGSIKGMKEKYYGKDALLVQCGSYIYKVPQRIYNMAKWGKIMANKNIEIIKGILNTQLEDEQKIYFIQSYLLNWIDEEEMKRIIESNKEEK